MVKIGYDDDDIDKLGPPLNDPSIIRKSGPPQTVSRLGTSCSTLLKSKMTFIQLYKRVILNSFSLIVSIDASAASALLL